MTGPAPDAPLPYRDAGVRVSTAWATCPRCGSAVPDWPTHERWHDVIEARVREAARRLVSLESRVTALEAPIV